jgi:hypothetical protein
VHCASLVQTVPLFVPWTQRGGATLPGGFVPQPELAVWKERSDGVAQQLQPAIVVVVELVVVAVLVVVVAVVAVVLVVVATVPVVELVVEVVTIVVEVVKVVPGTLVFVVAVVLVVATVVLVVASVVLVVVVAPGQTQPSWQVRNAPPGEFGSGQPGCGWPGGSHCSPPSTNELPHTAPGVVVVVVEDVVAVVAGVLVVVVARVVLVVVVAPGQTQPS